MPEASATYVDFTIQIDTPKNVTVRFIDKNGSDRISGRQLTCDPLTILNTRQLNAWVNFGLENKAFEAANPHFGQDALIVIGLNLYRILFGDDPIRDAFRRAYKDFLSRAKNNAALRLRLRLIFGQKADKEVATELAELSSLPWEFLFIPEQDGGADQTRGFFISGDRVQLHLTRFVDLDTDDDEKPATNSVETEKLRILIVLSTPAGEGDINTKELKELFEEIEALHAKPKIERLEGEECTPEKLTKRLESFRPHIVHFIGHGKEGKLAFIMPRSPDSDETIDGLQPMWIPASQFKTAFTNSGWQPRLVFLHACKGAVPTSSSAFNSCARELVAAAVPAVVAMQYNISSYDASLFAKSFYQGLGEGRDIGQAVKLGRIALGTVSPRWAHPRFAIPLAYLQADGPLVYSSPDDDSTEAGAGTAGSMASPVASSGSAGSVRPVQEASAPAESPDRSRDVSSFGR